ncbi:uncharacterized protein LOC142176059 [Nicotiana tabacum]|uniref:Uncharacterized protein LOC142176059 n=1 Tax=Nicotiana tabacum TaxID=4097 RepID=A0AC58TPR8_TOBAC
MAIEEDNSIAIGTSAGVIIDHHHPLYLQPCDTPCSSLISIQLTGSENYALWSISMKIGLIGKSKLGFVDSRCTKDKFGRSLHELWEKCNAIVLSWIMNAVSSDLLSGIVYKSSAHKVWTDLKDKFDKFLMGLNETYSQHRSQILMMSPVPSVNKAYSMVVSEESQRALGKFSQSVA